MLDAIKRKELEADLATLEVGDLNLSTYEKMMVLKLIQFMDDIEKYSRGKDEPAPRQVQRPASYSAGPTSDFTAAITGKDMNEVIQIMDELMDTLKTVNGRAYTSVMRKINAL